MKELTFSDEGWAEVQHIANETGLPPEKVVGRAIGAYSLLLEIFNQQRSYGYPDADVEVIGKKKRIITVHNDVKTTYSTLKGLLGLDDKS